MVPYTYLLRCKLDGRCYYGVRYSKKCHPNDLFVTYFSSSKAIKQLIAEHGPEIFEATVRRTFSSVDEARRWEHKVLRRINAANHQSFFNLTNKKGLPSMPGDLNPMRNPVILARWKAAPKKVRGPQSVDHIQARSKALTGRKRSEQEKKAISAGLKGYKHSDEFRQMRSRLQTGKKPSDENKEKKRQAILGRKKYTNGMENRYFYPSVVPEGWKLYAKSHTMS